MYASYFNLKEIPFSIAPDPAFLYMSPRHQEALGHLLYGTGKYGGFVQITGEVGTGKTTIIRTLLAQQLDGVAVAMVHNPRQSEQEFVQSICDELGVDYAKANPTLKTLVDALNKHLLAQHELGRRTVLIIDEAQQLAPEVLEQVRLLTNLETNKEKLLRIMLVGQPELAELLARNDLRQLAQRITARYHLTPLTAPESEEYIKHRLKVAGGAADLFTPAAIKAVFRHSGGVPRLINVLADRALLGTYSQSLRQVTAEMVNEAAAEVFGLPIAPRKAAKPVAPVPAAAERARGPRFTLPSMPKLPAMPAMPNLPSLPRPSMRQVEYGLGVIAIALAIGLVYRYWDARPEPKAVAAKTASAPANAAFVTPEPNAPPLPEEDGKRSKGKADQKSSAESKATATKPEPTRKPADPTAELAKAASLPLNQQMLKLGRLWLPAFKASRSEAACRSLRRQRVECFKGNGEWSTLAGLNSPALLTVSFGRGDVRYLLLRELNKSTATVLGPKGKQQFSLKALDPYWTGEYLTLWKRETDEVVIGPETRGDPILWLRAVLGERLGKPIGNPDNPRWDTELKTAVQRFQSAQGIRPDGIASARTLLALASGGPKLRR